MRRVGLGFKNKMGLEAGFCAPLLLGVAAAQGGAWKKVDGSDGTFAAAPKTKVVTCFILFSFSFFLIDFLSRFWAFRDKGGSKTRKSPFFLCFFFFVSLGCFARFFLIAFLGVS